MFEHNILTTTAQNRNRHICTRLRRRLSRLCRLPATVAAAAKTATAHTVLLLLAPRAPSHSHPLSPPSPPHQKLESMSAGASCGRAARSRAGAPATVQLELAWLLPATTPAVCAVWRRHSSCAIATRATALLDGRLHRACQRCATDATLWPRAVRKRLRHICLLLLLLLLGSAITSGEAFSSFIPLARIN